MPTPRSTPARGQLPRVVPRSTTPDAARPAQTLPTTCGARTRYDETTGPLTSLPDGVAADLGLALARWREPVASDRSRGDGRPVAVRVSPRRTPRRPRGNAV
ncbi:hypothetical protein GCM10018777_06630 [Streptomyces albogriseolus]|nr:hypothetical protein GCM10018777_06630 [Streptomyces viridodiastaticus]